MAFDFKKEYKDLYRPKAAPGLIEVPEMQFLAVRGQGDPNQPDGAYQKALEVLYGLAYTLKMSKMGSRAIEGYFDYVVPPLEGLWWQEGREGVDTAQKDSFHWISLLRLPEFVKEEDFRWAMEEAARKKKKDFSQAELFTFHEGLCVQAMHQGPYDTEPETLAAMDAYAVAQGCQLDWSQGRYHHEIYLKDPRKTAPEKLQTVLRHPIRRKEP